MRAFQVEPVPLANQGRVVDAIVLAFTGDPAARWMYPDAADYIEHFPEFVRAFGGRAFESGMVHQAGDFRGASLWLAPGVHPDDDGVANLIARSIPERDCAVMVSLFEQMAQYHPREPHWYLPLIGVEPQEQGNGYGSALLHHALARFDAEGTLAYLETSNVKNIPFYRRHGFEVMGTIQVGTSPPIVPMLRRPL